MEGKSILYSSVSVSVIFSLLILIYLLKTRTKGKVKLPPSPPNSLPIIGHLHLFKHPLHRTLDSLSQNLGPIISLRLGSNLVYVVSSFSIAEECFTKNDIVLANRPPILMNKYVAYNFTTLVSAPYGDFWRNIRKIAALEIFSTHRLKDFLSMRRHEIHQLIIKLARESSVSRNGWAKVELKSLFMNLTLNTVLRMVVGKRYYGDDVGDGKKTEFVRKLISDVISYGGAGSKEDYFPILNLISNYENKLKKLGKNFDCFLQSLIDEQRTKNEKEPYLIDHLLSLQETNPEDYSDQIIKAILEDLILGGTDTSSVTLEWALTNLLNNPSILEKARMEVDSEIGEDRLIDEADLSKLYYLQNIITETFRLTPTAPLLLPHISSDDCVLTGYDMPRNTTLLVNVWSIHRDPREWDEPTIFKPERFEKEGKAEKVIPFGLGRRKCPGESMACRTVGLTLGLLIQCFEWEKVDDMEIDMSEGKGPTMSKVVPLVAMCKCRPLVQKLLSESL